MYNQNLKSSVAPFDTKAIITMLAALPGRDYKVIACIVERLITEDTIDLKHLGNDLTLTDQRQILGISSDMSFDGLDVVWLIWEKGVNSSEYQFALERRLQLTRKAVLKGVKSIHDRECSKIFDRVVGPRQRNFNPWLKEQTCATGDGCL